MKAVRIEAPGAVALVEISAPLPAPGEVGHGPTHPFFIAGQFHPELTSRPLAPQPLFMGLVAATIHRKYKGNPDAALAQWLRTPKGAPAGV